ncbi:MAG: hypothetical protein N3F09_01060 [Bacteroidia bacterium]|nr:hypothetical protein [Bacteroidia bacterium]
MHSQTIRGTVNAYATVTNICGRGIYVNSASGFNVGDKVLLIQMQGVSINTTNTSSFGDITAINNAGKYEFLTVSSIRGNTVFTTSNPQYTYNMGPLQNY